MTRFWQGLTFGIVLGGAIAAAATVGALRRTRAQLERGWNPISVVVAARAVDAGAVLSEADLAERVLPSQFAPGHFETARKSELLGRVVHEPLLEGQALVASQLAEHGLSDEVFHCVARIAPAVDRAGVDAVERALAELRAHQAQREAAIAAVPEVVEPAPGDVEVVVLDEDVEPGDRVEPRHLSTAVLPRELYTHSHVLAAERDALLGATFVHDAVAGEPLSWTLLDYGAVPDLQTGCERRLDGAVESARRETARRLAMGAEHQR